MYSNANSTSSKVLLAVVLLLIGLAAGFMVGFAAGAQRPGPQAQVTSTITGTSIVTVSSSARPDILQYCFSPGGNCGSVIIHWISRANSSIHILIYSFTLDDVREALIQARNRGVDVKVVMEHSTVSSSGSEYQNLKNAGLDIRLDTNSGDMHDKVAIIDSHIIITGSMNWTNAGENQNNENLIVIDSQSWAQAYETQFQRVYSASAP